MNRLWFVVLIAALSPNCSDEDEPLDGSNGTADTGVIAADPDAGLATDSGFVPVRPDAGALVLADSVADFSGVQGRWGWLYGYIDPITSPSFQAMQVFASSGNQMKWFVDPQRFWTALGSDSGHPNGTQTPNDKERVVHHVVRRWLSNYEGDVRITGSFSRQQPSDAGNGVSVEVRVDGRTVWSMTLDAVPGARLDFDIAATVRELSAIDFYADAQGNDGADEFAFNALILRVP